MSVNEAILHRRVSGNHFFLACVALRLWLGALNNKGLQGLCRSFSRASPLVRLARQNRHATQANAQASIYLAFTWAQLFEDRLALTPG